MSLIPDWWSLNDNWLNAQLISEGSATERELIFFCLSIIVVKMNFDRECDKKRILLLCSSRSAKTEVQINKVITYWSFLRWKMKTFNLGFQGEKKRGSRTFSPVKNSWLSSFPETVGLIYWDGVKMFRNDRDDLEFRRTVLRSN